KVQIANPVCYRQSRRENRCDFHRSATRCLLFAFCMLNFALTTLSAQSKDARLSGPGKLNVAKSTFTPGPPIKADTRSYEVIEGWLIVTTETTQPSGEKTGVRFAARFDGREYRRIGRVAPTVTLISHQPVSKRTLKYTVKDTSGKGTPTT